MSQIPVENILYQPTLEESFSFNVSDSHNVSGLKDNVWPRSISYWIVLGYLALTIIRPWEKLFPWMADIHFERLYVILMLGAFLFFVKKQPILSLQTAAVIVFSLSLILNCLTAYNTSVAWDTFNMYLAFIIFYFILVSTTDTPYSLFFIISFYIFIMFLYLGKSQWEFWIHGQHRYDMGVIRMTGIEASYGGPNALAMSIVCSLPFALFIWKHRKTLTYFWAPKWSKKYKYIVWSYWIIAICSIIMTNSRSGMLSFIFYLMIIFICKKGFLKKIGYAFSGILILSIIWLCMPAENQNRLRTVWAPEEGPENAQVSADGRIEGFFAGLEMFSKNPITGVGLGNFVEYRVRNVDGVELNAHNFAGQILGELGLSGTVPFLFIVLAIFRSCRRIKKLSTFKMDKPDIWVDFATSCRDAVFLLFFTGLFGHNMLRYNWLWIAAFSYKALFFLENYDSKTDG